MEIYEHNKKKEKYESQISELQEFKESKEAEEREKRKIEKTEQQAVKIEKKAIKKELMNLREDLSKAVPDTREANVTVRLQTADLTTKKFNITGLCIAKFKVAKTVMKKEMDINLNDLIEKIQLLEKFL